MVIELPKYMLLRSNIAEQVTNIVVLMCSTFVDTFQGSNCVFNFFHSHKSKNALAIGNMVGCAASFLLYELLSRCTTKRGIIFIEAFAASMLHATIPSLFYFMLSRAVPPLPLPISEFHSSLSKTFLVRSYFH